jgi:putative oxidoreductase
MSSPAKGSARLDSLLTPLAQLVTRIVFGQAFFLVGLGKLRDLATTTANFEAIGIPMASVQAPVIATLECVGGLCLLIGFGTRPAALLLMATMIVAAFTAHASQLVDGLIFNVNYGAVAPLPYLVAMLWLAAKGAGKVSVDHLLGTRKKGG